MGIRYCFPHQRRIYLYVELSFRVGSSRALWSEILRCASLIVIWRQARKQSVAEMRILRVCSKTDLCSSQLNTHSHMLAEVMGR